MRFRNNFLLLFLVLGLLALRLGILLTSVEIVSHYDELDLGTIARELSRGLHVPFWHFQLDTYSGEALILGPLVLPFAKAFGQNLFAIKIVPLIFSMATLCAIYAFMLRYLGEKAARYSGLLFVLAPPGLVQLSLSAMAGHSEAFFFGFLALFCFQEFLFKGRRILFLALFGLASGFAVWFYYANAILIASCLLVFFILEHRLFFRSLPVFIPAFFASFSPWFFSNFRNQFMGLELVSENISRFDTHRLLHLLKQPAKLFLISLPSSFATLPVYFVPKKFAAYTHYLVLVFTALPFFVRQGKEFFRKNPSMGQALIFFVYPFVYLGFMMVSTFDFDRDIGFVGYRYGTPLVIMLLLAAGISAALFLKRKTAFIALLSLGLIGQSSLLFKEPVGRALAYQGYSYYQLGTRWHFNLSQAFSGYEDFQRKTAGFSARERRLLLWGITEMSRWNNEDFLFEARPGYAKDITVEAMAQKEPPGYEVFSYEWMGGLSKFSPSQGMAALEDAFKTLPEPARKYFCQGWLRRWEQAGNFMDDPEGYAGKNFCDIRMLDLASVYVDGLFVSEWERRIKNMNSLKKEEKIRAYRGLGYGLFFFNGVLNPLFKREEILVPGPIPEENRPDVDWGVGWGIREKFREDKTRALDWIARLPVRAQGSALKGLEAFDQWYGLV